MMQRMDESLPKIPDGYKEPIGPEDTDSEGDAEWTRNRIGNSWLTPEREAILRKLKEQRDQEG
jgi:hypothetical protein